MVNNEWTPQRRRPQKFSFSAAPPRQLSRTHRRHILAPINSAGGSIPVMRSPLQRSFPSDRKIEDSLSSEQQQQPAGRWDNNDPRAAATGRHRRLIVSQRQPDLHNACGIIILQARYRVSPEWLNTLKAPAVIVTWGPRYTERYIID